MVEPEEEVSSLKTVGIDARMYGLAHAGIGRYVKNIVTEVTSLESDIRFVLFLNREAYEQESFGDSVVKVLADVPHYTVREQFQMLALLRKYPCDLVHFPHFTVPLLYSGSFIVTIHDILWHTQKGSRVTTLPPLMYYLKYLAYRLTVFNAVRRAKAIVTPSTWVADQLMEQFGTTIQSKISVQYEGVDRDIAEAEPDKSIMAPLNVVKPYFIYTGSAYPHKNLKRLLDALVLVRKEFRSASLVIVSSRTVFLDELEGYVRKRGLESAVVFAGYVTDAQLKALYQDAVALVHPSLSEGFGLTGLEAMSVGLPVVSSTAGSLPEIYGDQVTYVDPADSESIASGMIAVLNDASLRKKVPKQFASLAQRYDWSIAGKALLNLYENIS